MAYALVLVNLGPTFCAGDYLRTTVLIVVANERQTTSLVPVVDAVPGQVPGYICRPLELRGSMYGLIDLDDEARVQWLERRTCVLGSNPGSTSTASELWHALCQRLLERQM